MQKKIAVLVSGGGTNLQALIDAQKRGEIKNGVISAVISSTASAFALRRAEQAGIQTFVIGDKKTISNRALSVALREKLQSLDIDLVVMAGFMRIVTKELVQAYPNAIINVHPALVPSFAGKGCYGLHVHRKALEYGVKLSGATIHFVSEECDGGPIIMQKSVDVYPDDTPETLQMRIMVQAEWVLLAQAVSLFCQDRIQVEGRTVRILS